MKNPHTPRIITLAVAISTLALTYAASAANIGFVGGLTSGALDKPFDIGWAARLASQGHSVTPIDQTTSSNSPIFTTIDLLIVSQDVGSGTYLNNVGIGLPIPILTYEYGLYDDIFGVGGQGASAGIIDSGITISDSSHPLAAGLSGTVSIYSATNATISRFNSGSGSAGTVEIAVSASATNYAVFAVLPAGAVGAGGQTWSALRMALPCYDNWDPTLVTTDGWKLLDNAVNYALVPEPSSIALLGLGMASLLVRRHRR